MTGAGFTLQDGRRGGYCWAEKPRCVLGHRLRMRGGHVLVVAEAVVECQHRQDRGGDPCGIRQYVQRVEVGQGHLLWLVVEVHEEHVQAMRERARLPLEHLALVGLALPGVETDLIGAGGPNGTQLGY